MWLSFSVLQVKILLRSTCSWNVLYNSTYARTLYPTVNKPLCTLSYPSRSLGHDLSILIRFDFCGIELCCDDTVMVLDKCPYCSGVDSIADFEVIPASYCSIKCFGKEDAGSHVARRSGHPSHKTYTYVILLFNARHNVYYLPGNKFVF